MPRMPGALRRHIRRLHTLEEGMTLVEMMVAIIILGIALSAFAGLLISTIRATSRNERTVTATALAQEVVEEMQAATWDNAGLYDNEVAAADADTVIWKTRLSAADEFESRDLVLIGAYAVGERVATIPTPFEFVTRGKTDFRIDRYVSWLDRDGIGGVDTRLFTAFVSWDDPFGGPQELRFDSERAPTKAENAPEADGMRILYFYVSPDPVDLIDNKPSTPIKVVVRTNLPTVNGTLTWESLNIAAGPPIVLTRQSNVALMTQSDATTVDGYPGWTTWTATLPSRDYFNGTADFRFTATAANPALSNPDAGRTVTFRGGTYDEAEVGGSPTATPTPTATVTPTPPTFVSAGTNVGAVCIVGAESQLQNGAITINAQVQDLAVTGGVPDGTVTVTYTYRPSKNGTPTSSGAVPLTYVSQSGINTFWSRTIPAGSHYWKSNDSVNFIFTVTRTSDTTSSSTTITKAVGVC